MRGLTLTLIAAFAMSAAAGAQSPSELLKGRWISEGAFCGQSIYDITGVEPNGTVRGTFTCVKTNWKPILGDVMNRNSVKATFIGNHFVMENVDGGGSDLVLNGTKLEGKGKVNAKSPANPVTYIKQ
jgi:hypothetical protein